MVPTIAATEIDNSFGITEASPAFIQKSDFIVTPALNLLRTDEQQFKLRTRMTTGSASATEELHRFQNTLTRTSKSRATNVIGTTHLCLFTHRGSQQGHQPAPSDSRFSRRQKMASDASDVQGLHGAQPVRRRFNDEILRLRELGELDPTLDDKQCKAYLDQFSRKNSH